MMHSTPDQIAYMQAHVGDDRTNWFLGVNIACLVVAYVSVGLRFLSRWKIGTSFGLDDWLICGGAACVTGHVSCLFGTVKYGMGKHIILATKPKIFVILSLTAQTFYNLSIPFIKLSILCLYRRIFRRTNGWFMPTLWLSGLFVFLFTIPQCFVYIFQCVPIESLWSELAPGSRVVCINFRAAIIAFGVINIVTDWFLLGIPIPVVLGLQLDTRTKWSICSLFLIGGFVCIISIVRLIYAKDVETVDPTWDYVPIASISTLEASAGILAACMPTWRPLFRFLGQGITSYFSGSRSNGDSNLRYGNNVEIGRGRWSSRSRTQSRSRSRKGLRAPPEKHYPAGGRLSFKPGTKRSDTSMSGDSVEKILKGGIGTQEIELEITKLSTGTPPPPTADHAKSSKSGSPRGTIDLNLAGTSDACSYSATAGSDRWESLMTQQRLKNESQEREKRRGRERSGSPAPGIARSYGDVAFGGRAVAAMGDKERGEAARKDGGDRDGSSAGGGASSGWGLGLEGIVVTKTVTSVSGTGRRSGDGR